MRRDRSTLIVGLAVYAVVVAVTLGLSLGGHYQQGEGGAEADSVSSATIPGEEGYPVDSETSATPMGSVVDGPDAGTGATPYSDSTSPGETLPDTVTGASPFSETPTPDPTTPPDTNTG